jgi:hypothetical protein
MPLIWASKVLASTVHKITDPDPGGPKPSGFYGFGSGSRILCNRVPVVNKPRDLQKNRTLDWGKGKQRNKSSV